MARVLLLALRFWPATGGVEARTWEVARRLAKQHDITVLTSDLRREQPFERLAEEEALDEAEGVRILRLPAAKRLPIEGYGVFLEGLGTALRTQLREAQVLEAHPYGAAHTDFAVPKARAAGVPVALTAHLHPAETAGHPWLRSAYDTLRGGPTLRAADRVVAVTEHEASLLSKGFRVPRERIALIPNGLDSARFRDLGQPREPGLLLGVGRLASVKGFDLAIEALAMLRNRGRLVRLILAGEDWGEQANLEALARRLGVREAVEFTGRVEAKDLLDLYNRAEVLLAPSRYEAFGIAALEAVSCGCPAIVSDVGGLPAAAGPGGIAVPREANAFAKATDALLQDAPRRASLAQAGRAHAEAHDWDLIAAQVDELWTELASGASKGGRA